MSRITDLCLKYVKCQNETARAGIREQILEALPLEPYPIGTEHSMIWHVAPMHCELCGKLAHLCDCNPETIRAMKCLDCGFRVSTGGRSIMEMITPKPQKPS